MYLFLVAMISFILRIVCMYDRPQSNNVNVRPLFFEKKRQLDVCSFPPLIMGGPAREGKRQGKARQVFLPSLSVHLRTHDTRHDEGLKEDGLLRCCTTLRFKTTR